MLVKTAVGNAKRLGLDKHCNIRQNDPGKICVAYICWNDDALSPDEWFIRWSFYFYKKYHITLIFLVDFFRNGLKSSRVYIWRAYCFLIINI